jgi:amidophosphoribosyltransferase
MVERYKIAETNIDNLPSIYTSELDKPHEECGVVGILITGDEIPIADLIREGLVAVQHRGQEAAGVAVSIDDQRISILKDVGYVADVMGGTELTGMPKAKLAIGHVRYGTVRNQPATNFDAAGPSLAIGKDGMPISIAHNGNVTNMAEICEKAGLNESNYSTDSHALTAAVASVRETCDSLPEALVKVLGDVQGAFSLAVMGEDKLIAVRDPHGFRPLNLGTYPDKHGYAIASETPALLAMGASFRREVARGEMVVCDKEGNLTSTYPFDEQPSSLCAFEFVYFSAPHGELEGRSVHMVRKKMGEILATEHPVEADAVIGVPESGTPGGEGYSLASGIPKVSGIIKNRSVTARTFITPGQDARKRAVQNKIRVIQPEVYKRRLVVVDDSIVRGTTMKETVAMLYENGASEVHLRITSAPYKWPCFYGMDTGDPEELIANKIPNKEDLIKYLGVDSLEYLSLEGLRSAAADAAGKLCTACMDGEYPTAITLSKKARIETKHEDHA